MSFMKSRKTKEDLKQGGGSNYISTSGCFPVNIIASFVSKSKNGSESVDFYLNHESQEQVMYGNVRVSNNDESVNEIGAKVFNQLMIVAELDEVSDPIEAELPIGKGGTNTDVSILEDLCDIDVLMRVQMEYAMYNGGVQEKKVIKAFFRASDNASAEEIVNDENFGEQYKKEMKYFDNVTYKDNLDADAIAKWIADGRPKAGGGGGAGASAPAKKPGFSKKRSFGK
jgi:hypothetical protein